MSDTTMSMERSKVLVLSREHMDALWLKSLVRETCEQTGQRLPEFVLEWCPSPDEVQQRFREQGYDGILWDTSYHLGDPLVFLNFLMVASSHCPVIAMGALLEDDAAPPLIRAGCADYLCRGYLRGWSLVRSFAFAYFRGQAELRTRQWLQQDELTGVVSRSLFFDRLKQALLRADRNRETLCVLNINIDDFRSCNESLGYKAGDQLVMELARRISSGLRRCDCVARMGGDEFALILEQIDDTLTVTRIIAKQFERLAQPFTVDGQVIGVTVSVGVATYQASGETADDLVRHAGHAMLEAKKIAGNSYAFYNRTVQHTVARQLRLEAEFRHALRADELEVHYQPRVDLGSGDVLSVESLVRWMHPENGLIMPDKFIPAAERSGLIVPMGYWVLERATRDLKTLTEDGHENLLCAVNFSFRQFHDRQMTATVFRILYNGGVDAGRLELELTESAMMHDVEYTLTCLRELGKLGVAFSLDDFGTGYSSLTHLQQLPVGTVKIDKSFVAQIGVSSDSEHIVRAIIALAHNLQMCVIAEGVETREQADFLLHHHCDQAQGYYFSRPLRLPALREYLRRQSQPLLRPVAH